LRLILVGYGNVGKSFHNLLDQKREMLRRVHGLTPKVVAVVDKGGAAIDPRGLRYDAVSRVKHRSGTVSAMPGAGRSGAKASDIIGDVDSEAMVELTPSNLRDGEPGMTHIIEAMRSGKHVITANKGPLALALPALDELALHNGVRLLFSGTVGGGTPFISLIRRSMRGNEVVSLRGILNGTTNFVLSSMERNRSTLEDALSDAKRLGYAEADSSLDVNGLDAAAKLAILTNVTFGRKITVSDVAVEGIGSIDQGAILRASERKTPIRLVAEASPEVMGVAPREVSADDPLCVYGPLNAMCLAMEGGWQVSVVGKGAGGLETAQAVLRDLVELRESLSSPGQAPGSPVESLYG